MSFEGESGHYYYTDGRPCYEVPDARGNMRPTTLRDARKLSLVKSVTTHLNVIAKPALVNWMVDQGIMAALTMPRVEGENEPTYIKRIKEDSRKQAKAAAEEGGRIHDAIEKSFKGQLYDAKYGDHVGAARLEIARLYPGVDDWIAEKSFAHPLGFAGKVDLHSPSTGIVHDWKSKDGPLDDDKRLAYDQNYQLAAYQVGLALDEPVRDGLRMPKGAIISVLGRRISPCGNSFVSRTHPGAIRSHVWSAEEIESGWRIFRLALELSQELSGYSGKF